MTTKELIKAHNDLAAAHGLPPLQGWKASKEALQARIDGLMIREAEEADPLAIPEAVQAFGDAGPDQVPPSAAEDATDDHGEPTEARGGIGRMIEELLVDAEGYGYVGALLVGLVLQGDLEGRDGGVHRLEPGGGAQVGEGAVQLVAPGGDLGLDALDDREELGLRLAGALHQGADVGLGEPHRGALLDGHFGWSFPAIYVWLERGIGSVALRP